MKYSKLITLLLALLVCFSLVVTASAASGMSLAVEAQASTVEYGKTIKVSVNMNSNPGNLGVNFDIKWDTNVLEVVSVEKSGSAFKTVEANQQAKRIVVTIANPMMGIMSPSTAEQVTGTGKVLDVTFKVKTDADITTKITFDRVSYVAMNGESTDKVSTTAKSLNVISTNHKHTPGAEATCTTNQICTHCFAELVPAKGHKPGAAATCTTNQICTVCSVELKPALGHKSVTDKAVAPTCTATGLTEGAHCSVCSEVLKKQDVVPALGHKPGAAATCTTNQTCTVCKVELAPALGHTAVALPAVAPTCTETGLTAGSGCSVCKVVLTAQEEVAATGHDWSKNLVNTNKKNHWNECKVCGEKKNIKAHTMENGVCTACGYGCKHQGGNATCSALAVCTVCGNGYGKYLDHTPGAAATCSSTQNCTVCNAVIAEKLPHDLETVKAQAATCGEAGWNDYEKCKNCDYTTYAEIAATGVHTYGEWVVVTEATTQAAGEKKHTCTDCGASESEVIPVLVEEPADFSWIIFVILGVVIVIIIIIIVAKKKKKYND